MTEHDPEMGIWVFGFVIVVTVAVASGLLLWVC